MVHGLNEGYIAPYTDIEFQLRSLIRKIFKKIILPSTDCFQSTDDNLDWIFAEVKEWKSMLW